MSVTGGDGAALDAGVVAGGEPPAELTPEQRFAAAARDQAGYVVAQARVALDGQREKLAKLDESRAGVLQGIESAAAAVAAAESELSDTQARAAGLGV